MKNIAILTCLHACRVCTGASCLNAWNTKTKSFEPYLGQEVQLAAFMHCNGCGVDVQTDQGMAEKLQRLEKIQVDTVHVGVCTIVGKTPQERHLCPTIEKLTEMLSEKGIRVVFGTH